MTAEEAIDRINDITNDAFKYAIVDLEDCADALHKIEDVLIDYHTEKQNEQNIREK